MDNLLNTGTGLPAWFDFIKIIIVIGYIILSIIYLVNQILKDIEGRRFIKLLFIQMTIWAILIFFAFSAFGPGIPVTVQTEQDEGIMQLTEESGNVEKQKRKIDPYLQEQDVKIDTEQFINKQLKKD